MRCRNDVTSLSAPVVLVARWLLASLCLLFACAPARAGEPGSGLAVAYANYPELAAAVRQRTEPEAAPSPALAALAHELTAGRADPHARALALADWVRTHIRRSGGHLRFDGAAPRRAAVVLRERAGNEEEIVLLLRALLTESGVASTVALIGRGDRNALPETAMPAAFERMLAYLPDLGMYLDPATDNIAAGYLPPSLLGRPVLLAGGAFAMTPMTQPQSLSIRATVDIGRDGKGTIRLDRTYAGVLAEPIRKAVRNAAPAAQEQFVRRLLPGLQEHAPRSPVPRALDLDGGAFQVSLSGIDAHVLTLPQARALPTIHPYLSTVADALASMPWDSTAGRNVACPAIDAADETRYQLPKQVKILTLPAPASVTRGGVFYRAAYERQGNTVLVKRRLTFRNGRPACTPAEISAMRPALERVALDLRSRVTIAMR